MAESHDARLVELVTELGGDDVRFLFWDLVQKALEALEALIDAELTEAIGAGPHERTDTRTNRRNGGRSRVLSVLQDRFWVGEHSPGSAYAVGFDAGARIGVAVSWPTRD